MNSYGQKITTTGNATIIAYDDLPIIATDPWYGDEDSAYFGSWILSHQIPSQLKKDIIKSKYIWFSHGHPDHLNPNSIKRFKGKKILLPDHIGSRIYNDLSNLDYDVTILPDREWVQLSKNIKIQCITNHLQDSILLIDVCEKLFINLNDAGVKGCSNYIKKISQNYEHSYVLVLAGYGDADMINFFDEDGNFIEPMASKKLSVGEQYNYYANLTNSNHIIPFSSFHQYQRTDSIWAQKYTTPIEAFGHGVSNKYDFIPEFSSVDCNSLETYQNDIKPIIVKPKKPEEFGDNWSDELTQYDKKVIRAYFEEKEMIKLSFGFISFVVGGKTFTIKMEGKPTRGITFSLPRNSLMTAIEYRIFDDLLIGNFMKTTLHDCNSLYDRNANFTHYVSKFSDNGNVNTKEEIYNYLKNYKIRMGNEFIIDQLTDRSKDFLIRFIERDSKIFEKIKYFYSKLR